MFANLILGDVITARVRLVEPLELMRKLYNVDYEIIDNLTGNTKLEDEGGVFLIRARTFNLALVEELRGLKLLCDRNCVQLYEIDDSPKIYPDFYASKKVDFIASHAITCSTEILAEEIRELNPYVKVFKNQIMTLMPKREYEKKNYTNLFFGAINREESWAEIMPIINKFAKKYKDKLRFTVIADEKFYDSLQTPHKTLISNDFVPYDQYMGELKKADIALLPLKDTEFNRAKSDLKFLEAGNAGTAVIASPTVYEATIKDGEMGFIYRSPREFQAKFDILIKDRTKRIEMAKAAYEYVKRERLLINHVEERYNWMREMYQRRKELYIASLQRMEANFG